MLPIKDLLNPVSSERDDVVTDEAISSASASPAAGLQSTVATSPSPESSPPPVKLGRCSNNNRSTPQEPINYRPHTVLDSKTLALLKQYGISSATDIGKHCDHIPYNSSKKDLYHKTGRDSLEVFQYDFYYRSTEYTVMWDYSVGLVRMTPFFKCMGFSKTKPSQVLDKNPGLRDICPSITGGAVLAQGYWMPYSCAREICLTFCYNIAPALIPLFGPSFPSQCIPPNAQGYEQMRVTRSTIDAATIEIRRFRELQLRFKTQRTKQPLQSTQSPYGSRVAMLDCSSRRSHREHSPRPSSVWTAINTGVNASPLPSMTAARPVDRRVLVDQRPRAMRSLEPRRLDSIHNIQSNLEDNTLPPIDARRSFPDTYSSKRRRTDREMGHMAVVGQGVENQRQRPKRGAELHAASLLMGMQRGPGNPLDRRPNVLGRR